MTHRQPQPVALLGTSPAFIVVALVWQHARDLPLNIKPPPDDASDRIGFAVYWLLPPAPTLVASLQAAARRDFIVGAIDGTRIPRHWDS